MDDRRKQIGELEKSRKSSQLALNVLLGDLGKALLTRQVEGADAPAMPEIDEYHRLQKEIADSEASILVVEARIARQKNLEEDIESREQQDKTRSKELAVFYAKLGKLVLEDPALDDFAVSWRAQADVLIPKVQSLEERVAGLSNQADGRNVFTWIGKGAQGMVLRSFLTKATDNLERLYRNVGEQFCRMRTENVSADRSSSVEIADLGSEIEKNRDLARTLAQELSKLREELLEIDDEYDALGGPVKQIQNIRKHIGHTKEMLSALYLRFGEAAFGETADEAGAPRAGAIESLLSEADRAVLDEAARIRQSIRDDGESINKLQASIDIDDELEQIEKIRASIAVKNMKIDEARKNIEEFENQIKDAEKHIEELRQLL